MMDTRFVESFLRLNNVGANASAAEIKTVLAEAHWPPEEVEEALLAHASAGTKAQTHDDLAFRPDMHWSSPKLSSLLGIDVVIDPKSFRMPASTKEQFKHAGKKILGALCITAVAVAIAASLGIGLLYFFELGPFYTQAVDII